MLPLIGLAASLAPTVFQTILGINQKNQADNISPGERPKYEVPKAEQESLNLQRLLASSTAPGYTQAKEDIESASANQLLAGMKMGNPNVSMAFRNKTDALKDLNMNNELYRERQQQGLVNKLSEYAGYQEKAFDINEMQPYQYALQQSMNLKDASNQNIYGAIGDASSGVLQYLQTINGNKTTGPGEKENKTPDYTQMTDNPQFWEQLKTENPQTYSALSDKLKQQSATTGGVITPESNAQMDKLIQMLISNPDLLKTIGQGIIK